MIRIDIRPVWRFRSDDEERAFDFQLVAVLDEVERAGKLTQAAETAGISYRHAWNLVEDWERFFEAPLVAKEKGRGTRLTPLGERLLAAGRRAQARLAPELDNLAAEFADALNKTLSEAAPALVVHASHDYAIARLRERMAGTPAPVALQYKGSFDALAALRRGECDFAGFHLPEGPMGTPLAQRYTECLPPAGHRLVHFATRTQGLMVRAGNPLGIAGVRDLCRGDVRMVNRQRGSGTRALLELLVAREGLDRAAMRGYEREETTHGAVAALIAGNQADAGFGVQAAAAQFRLDFIPLCRERYLLACREATLATPAAATLLAALRDAAFRDAVAALPGYDADGAGRVVAGLEAAPSP